MQRAPDIPAGFSEALPAECAGDAPEEAAPRVRRLVLAHYREIWRVLRRLGVSPAALDDAAQQVFMIAAGKLSLVRYDSERAFLIGTAVRVASNERRRMAQERARTSDFDAAMLVDAACVADGLLEQKRLRELLDEVLDSLADDLRTVFVLFELEGLSISEIATTLGMPRGTAASRLRRAREAFHAAAARVRARFALTGGNER